MRLSGIADLPLHDGHVPQWLASRMKRLASLVLRVMHDMYGPDGMIERLASPAFFQAFNNVLGMDWDSSGSTTVTTAVIKEALRGSGVPVRVAGGKGRQALNAPRELLGIAREFGLDAERLIAASRLTAKVDSALVQDGYDIYHHAFFVSASGKWCVIQQGMNVRLRMARRYHWINTENFFDSPHAGIVGLRHERVLNLASRLSGENRRVVLELVNEGPASVARHLNALKGQLTLLDVAYYNPRADIRATGLELSEVNVKAVARNLPPPKSVADFKELLLKYRVGARTLRALSLVAELIYRAPADWNDPALDPFKFAFAVGGKDGVPYPVNVKVYDELIALLDAIVERARSDPEIYRHLARLAKRAEAQAFPRGQKLPRDRAVAG